MGDFVIPEFRLCGAACFDVVAGYFVEGFRLQGGPKFQARRKKISFEWNSLHEIILSKTSFNHIIK